MELESQQISEQQKDSWNKFSAGWKKWDLLMMDFLKPIGDEMIALVNPQENETVLDVASGTGEPGISLAAKIGNGKIILGKRNKGKKQKSTQQQQLVQFHGILVGG